MIFFAIDNFYRKICFDIPTPAVLGGIDDNEVAPQHERKDWEKKWRIPLQYQSSSATNDSPSPPTWSDTYISEGVLHLPYAEIDEPFYAWVDFKKGRSRIDYYGGTVNIPIVWHSHPVISVLCEWGTSPMLSLVLSHVLKYLAGVL